MALDYHELTPPTYKYQKGENKRGRFYFKIKLEEGLSQRGLVSFLKEKYDEIMVKVWSNPGQLRQELKPYFHKYDIDKAIANYDFEKGKVIDDTIIPLSQSQISVWSSDDCWVPREEDYIFDEDEDDRRAKKARRREVSMTHYEKKLNVTSDLWDRLEEDVRSEKLSQLNHGIQAAIAMDENLDKETGETKEFKANLNLNGDINSKTEVKTDLRTDLEKVQEQILSPAFAEVTRKLSTHLKEDTQ